MTLNRRCFDSEAVLCCLLKGFLIKSSRFQCYSFEKVDCEHHCCNARLRVNVNSVTLYQISHLTRQAIPSQCLGLFSKSIPFCPPPVSFAYKITTLHIVIRFLMVSGTQHVLTFCSPISPPSGTLHVGPFLSSDLPADYMDLPTNRCLQINCLLRKRMKESNSL